MSNVKLSAFSDEYADSFSEQLQALNSFGIAYTEIRHLNGKNVSALTANEVKEAKSELDRYGIKVSAIGSPLGKIALDGDMKGHIETAKRIFDAANVFGAKFIRVFSFYAPDGKKITEMKDSVIDSLGALLYESKKHGVTLCHENEANIYGDIPSRCLELLDTFGGELKCVFDMGNFVLEGVEPYSAYESLREHIAYFHIKDALAAGAIVPPGKGEAKIKEIIDAHRNFSKNDFFVSLEPHLQTFSGLNALVGRSFENPYKYEDQKSAFADAVMKLKEII